MANNNPELKCIGADCQSLSQLCITLRGGSLTHYVSPDLVGRTDYMMSALLDMTVQRLEAAAGTELSVSLTVT